MPIGEQHKKKRAKNLVVAGALILFVVLVFFGAMVQMGGG
jgi:hypothetical protein